MLILTRRINERIRIGDEVIVTVLSVRGNQVSIGVDAPLEVVVNREEVHDRMQEEDKNDQHV